MDLDVGVNIFYPNVFCVEYVYEKKESSRLDS